jgi:hypothetical protein
MVPFTTAIIVAGTCYAIRIGDTQSKSLIMLLMYVSQTSIMGSTFGLAFSISHLIFFYFYLSRHLQNQRGRCRMRNF